MKEINFADVKWFKAAKVFIFDRMELMRNEVYC